MTQDDKKLLLKDLCARLPYGVNLHIEVYDLQGDGEFASRDVKLTAGNIGYCFENSHWVNVKPYLRPMSSITDEERLYFYRNSARVDILVDEEKIITKPFYGYTIHLFDYLNAHHLDYRCLIEKGLALEATEGMYEKF